MPTHSLNNGLPFKVFGFFGRFLNIADGLSRIYSKKKKYFLSDLTGVSLELVVKAVKAE